MKSMKSGFSLVEILAVLSISAALLIALTSVTDWARKNTDFYKKSLEGEYENVTAAQILQKDLRSAVPSFNGLSLESDTAIDSQCHLSQYKYDLQQFYYYNPDLTPCTQDGYCQRTFTLDNTSKQFMVISDDKQVSASTPVAILSAYTSGDSSCNSAKIACTGGDCSSASTNATETYNSGCLANGLNALFAKPLVAGQFLLIQSNTLYKPEMNITVITPSHPCYVETPAKFHQVLVQFDGSNFNIVSNSNIPFVNQHPLSATPLASSNLNDYFHKMPYVFNGATVMVRPVRVSVYYLQNGIGDERGFRLFRKDISQSSGRLLATNLKNVVFTRSNITVPSVMAQINVQAKDVAPGGGQ